MTAEQIYLVYKKSMEQQDVEVDNFESLPECDKVAWEAVASRTALSDDDIARSMSQP